MNNVMNIGTSSVIDTTLVGNVGTFVYSGGSSAWQNKIELSQDLTKFIELVLAALGHDITWEDFSNMTDSQKNSLIRDIKLKTIL